MERSRVSLQRAFKSIRALIRAVARYILSWQGTLLLAVLVLLGACFVYLSWEVVLILVAIVAVVVNVPRLLPTPDGDGEARVRHEQLRNDLRKVVLQSVTGFALAAGVWTGWRQFVAAEDARVITLVVNAERDIWSDSVEKTRGALSSLEQAVRQSPLLSGAVCHTLCNFLRGTKPGAAGSPHDETRRQAAYLLSEVSRSQDVIGERFRIDLRNANLAGLKFNRAIFWDADLRGATLDGAIFVDCSLEGAILDSASLIGVHAERTNFNNADLRGAVLHKATMRQCSFVQARMLNLQASDSDLTACDMRGADLSDARLDGAQLGGVNFGEARLIRADLSGAMLWDAVWESADLAQAIFDGAIVDAEAIEAARNLSPLQVRSFSD